MSNAGTGGWKSGCRAAAVAVALAVAAACGGLDEPANPDLSGPADLGLSVELSAAPDIINADGVSASLVRLKLRDNVGRAYSGRAVLFLHDGDGVLTPSTGSRYVGPLQGGGVVMATDQSGQADVIYTAGTSYRDVTVVVRPYGTDSSMGFFREVEIWQR